ncbi:myo-inositol-1(or 4)-monophosphatase [Ruegeria halocynthiae]|uniref:Myo-inositol-1(Or 4)-monophosphatase n=1 Tax=Ruegeria halocynthiae TaxID=985054 RepID=A0A1H3BZ41_9RHOB|nr:3'(2'),5'-bisphosphate nucleotidase CysQ [Ruegeria halocynthiae]SDX47177.1 myo-inositol-1(or 4)-monophosphatase [Ruegeria halocynthiae]
MPATDLSLLIDAAREAGKIATRYSGPQAQRWEKPEGAGPVTEADLAVNAMLERDLQAARPNYGWLSEETEDSPDRLSRERVFVIDPIDGTRSFAEGSRTWAHSLAVAEHGEVTAAAIYLPQRDLLYAAAKGHGATLNGADIHVSGQVHLSEAEILAAKPNLDPRHWLSGVAPDFRRVYRPSLAYRMALVAQGRFDGMLTLRPSWEWDIAAGDLILREAGGICTDRLGQPLRFNNPHPRLNGVVAAGVEVHAGLHARLDPNGAGILA